MDVIIKHSKLHKELNLQEYAIPFKNLDEIETKEEFDKYINYFQIDIMYASQYAIKFLDDTKTKREFLDYVAYFKISNKDLLEQVLKKCKFLDYYLVYIKEDIVRFIQNDEKHCLNDENLKYISQYIEIKDLYAYNNPNITTIEPFAQTLKILYAGGNCGLDDNSLCLATNLQDLYASNNPKITTVEPFAKTLNTLHASGNCGIDDNGLKNASKLQYLVSYKNPKITTILPFYKTLRGLIVNNNFDIDENYLKKDLISFNKTSKKSRIKNVYISGTYKGYGYYNCFGEYNDSYERTLQICYLDDNNENDRECGKLFTEHENMSRYRVSPDYMFSYVLDYDKDRIFTCKCGQCFRHDKKIEKKISIPYIFSLLTKWKS